LYKLHASCECIHHVHCQAFHVGCLATGLIATELFQTTWASVNNNAQHMFVHSVMPHAAGMKFFPGYVNDARRQALDAAAFRWNQTGQEQKKLLKWGDRSQLQGGLLMLEAPIPQAVAQKGRQAKQRQALPAGETASSRGTGAVALVTGMPVWNCCLVHAKHALMHIGRCGLADTHHPSSSHCWSV